LKTFYLVTLVSISAAVSVYGQFTMEGQKLILLGSNKTSIEMPTGQSVEKEEIREEELVPDKVIETTDRIGFYILPFVGLQSSQDLEWKSFGGDFEIEEKNGISWGLRVGHEWEYAFTDFQLSGFTNSFDEMDIGFPGVEFSGESSGFGGMISGGLRYDFTRFLSASLGGGFGFVQQELSMSIMGIPVEDEDLLFTYHLFTGLELRPFEHFLIGLRYRWSRVGEMEYFSSRQIHFAELSAGYVF
jgi:opacity protein-like surface antigen